MTSTGAFERWLRWPKPNPNARLRLFCFPFGGGGASFYRSWPDGLPTDVEFCAVQLPGRENRLREPPFTQLSILIETLIRFLEPYLDIPFAFFGHSMGALIGFELARELRKQNSTGLIYLFVSGRRAPQIADPDPPKHNLPKSEFIDELRHYNGTPELVLQEPELMEIFLPLLRADFSILETYVYKNGDPIDCPITAFGGRQDSKVSHEDLAAWREQTCHEYRLKMFPGDHFYLKAFRARLLREITDDLERLF